MYYPKKEKTKLIHEEYSRQLDLWLSQVHCTQKDLRAFKGEKYLLFEKTKIPLPFQYSKISHFKDWVKYGDYFIQ